MNTSSNSTTDAQRAKAFKNLETGIHDLRIMAEISTFIAIDQLGDMDTSGQIKIENRVAELLSFSIYDVNDRADKLAKRFEAAFRGEVTE